jgi:hypothetical protein
MEVPVQSSTNIAHHEDPSKPGLLLVCPQGLGNHLQILPKSQSKPGSATTLTAATGLLRAREVGKFGTPNKKTSHPFQDARFLNQALNSSRSCCVKLN